MVRYSLDDGEELHREAPESFCIPDAGQRRALAPGQCVKLVFRIELEDDVHVERMWVIVRAGDAQGYRGILDNDPYCTPELRAGTPVLFEPRHVIDIHPDD